MVSPSPASASSAPAGSGQFSIHPRHERLLHPREDVGVDAQGDIDAGVPEHLAHDLGVLAPTESESRKAVAEVVEADRREFEAAKHRPEHALADVLPSQRLPPLIADHEVMVAPRRPGHESCPLLPDSVPTNGGHRPCAKGHRAARSLALRDVQDPVRPLPAQCVANGQLPLLNVDVLPPQGEELAEACASRSSQDPTYVVGEDDRYTWHIAKGT